jgi:hypothetical protein
MVDGLHPIQLMLEAIQRAAELRGRSAGAPLVAVEVPKKVAASLHHRLVVDPPGLVEEGGDLRVGHGLDAIDAKQRGLPPKRLDLLHQPLKEFHRLGSLGLLVLIVAPILLRYRANANVQGFIKGAYAAAIGTILGACVLLGKIAIGDWLTALIALASLVALFRWKVSIPLLVAAAAIVGLIAFPLVRPECVLVK